MFVHHALVCIADLNLSSFKVCLQVYRDCAKAEGGERRITPQPASVSIVRTEAYCCPHASPDEYDVSTPNMEWSKIDVHAVMAGNTPHPLAYICIFDTNDLSTRHNTKTLMNPTQTCGVHIHGVVPCPGSVERVGDVKCARIVHLSNLFRRRRDLSLATVADYQGTQKWWWPILRH